MEQHRRVQERGEAGTREVPQRSEPGPDDLHLRAEHDREQRGEGQCRVADEDLGAGHAREPHRTGRTRRAHARLVLGALGHSVNLSDTPGVAGPP